MLCAPPISTRPERHSLRCPAARSFWAGTLLLVGVATAMTVWYAPVHAEMGAVQKVLYFHLPAALNTLVACLVVFVASIAYLWQRDPRWDDLADGAARVSVLLCSVVLLTGMVWAHQAWGHWWVWTSPRLTFVFVLWLLYMGYLVVRPAIPDGRRAAVSAVYGIIAFLDIPLLYLSLKLMPDIHPESIELEPAMRHTLLVWLVAVTLLTGGLIAARTSLARLMRQSHTPRGHPAPAADPGPRRARPYLGTRA